MPGTPEDVTDLIQLVNRLFISADARDWQAYRSLMTEEVTLDFGGVGPTPPGRGRRTRWYGTPSGSSGRCT
jgi:hypothetical protein